MKKILLVIFSILCIGFYDLAFAKSSCLSELNKRKRDFIWYYGHNEHINYLDLNSCALTDVDIVEAINYVKEHWPYIKGLELANNAVSNISLSRLAEQKLEYLDLSDNNIGDEGAAILSRNGNLKFLVLKNGNIGVIGAQALSQLNRLVLLMLNNNKIGDEGANYIGQLTALVVIHLEGNGIGDNGTAYLATLPNLHDLNLKNNNIYDKGALAFLQTPKPEGIVLNLSYNHISQAAGTVLKQRHWLLLNLTGNENS